jgi:lycopene cyclase domain-containing protein
VTYWALNAIFLAVALVVALAAAVTRRRSARPGAAGARGGGRPVALLVTAAVLLVVSVVFDNVMIGIGLVGYNRDLISGAFLGIAPLEDFAYVIGAVLLLPALWLLLPARRRNGDSR